MVNATNLWGNTIQNYNEVHFTPFGVTTIKKAAGVGINEDC